MLFDPSVWQASLEQFFKSGGWVLFLLAWTALVMWSLLLERCWFRLCIFPAQQRTCMELSKSGASPSVQITKVGELQQALQASLPLIKTLIAICPLIGLLGTVTGMIQVFDILAFNGTGNPRLMSAGVAKATIPTMAGMVLAVSGLLMYTWLQRWSQLQLSSVQALSKAG
ncbi:MotA/TolQ/ExbB proton channel family protein [Litoribacillus peritrichatus]|uniref:MotA/TolQ/ExbB proton channel family protein n=1 Tax=Litoribacillus peritrichatus TaxID=718191 RepID=A0ABP7MK66_9GAMM